MIKQYGIYYKENPSKIFEIIRAGNTVKEECPLFYHNGAEFPCEDFGVRELTKREIEVLVLPTPNKKNIDRRTNEYSLWLSSNDENELLGNEYFYINGKKYYTINREEFKLLVDEAVKNDKHLIQYRGREFSVYHFY